MIKISYIVPIILFFIIGCSNEEVPSLEISFSSVVGKYQGNVTDCKTTNGDIICSDSVSVPFNVILKSETSVQVTGVGSFHPSAVYFYDQVDSKPNMGIFSFESGVDKMTYYKTTGKIMVDFQHSDLRFLRFEGKK